MSLIIRIHKVIDAVNDNLTVEGQSIHGHYFVKESIFPMSCFFYIH
jgi:hypothetical protein